MESSKPYSLKKLSGFVGNDPQQVIEMLHLFIDTIPPELVLLNKNAENHRFDEVGTIAHRIKPSIDVFDLKEAMAQIRLIELLCRENQENTEIIQLVKKLTSLLHTALNIMKTEI